MQEKIEQWTSERSRVADNVLRDLESISNRELPAVGEVVYYFNGGDFEVGMVAEISTDNMYKLKIQPQSDQVEVFSAKKVFKEEDYHKVTIKYMPLKGPLNQLK